VATPVRGGEERARIGLLDVEVISIEHVGSTSVPGLAAKPILDIDVIVEAAHMNAAIEALESVGYVHRGDLGLEGREAFDAPDDGPRRNVYFCTAGTLNVRNHLAVREVLRRRDDLRDTYEPVAQRDQAQIPTPDVRRRGRHGGTCGGWNDLRGFCETGSYATVKLRLAADPMMDIDTYIPRKFAVLQHVLADSELTPDERQRILWLNDPDA
jgi:GrpB protein